MGNRDRCTPIHMACKSGLLKVVLLLMDHDVDINARDKYKRSPLHYACDRGRLDVAIAVANQGADVNAEDEDQATPLHWSCVHGNMRVAMALVDKGADIHAKDKYGKEPKVNDEITTLFNRLWYATPLIKAMFRDDLEEFTNLLDSDCYDINEDIGSGWTLLHSIAYLNRVECLEKLLAYPLLNKRVLTTNKLQSALHVACKQGNVKIVRRLGAALLPSLNQSTVDKSSP